MFGSRNNFFRQSISELRAAKSHLIELLNIKRRNKQAVKDYLEAFDYFVANPDDYDGATIVKDLVDIRTSKGYLDIDAMLHDYEYIHGANISFVKKWKSDMKYLKNMERNGKGIRIPRMAFLTIAGVVFVSYKWLKNYYNEKFS